MKPSIFFPASVLLLAAASGLGQTASTAPSFDVATVKLAPPLTPELLGSGKAHTGAKIDKAYADFGGFSLTNLIAYAYRVKAFQVSGPDWMDGTRLDVLGKLPDGALTESVPEMLQALLAERFHLRLHTESKDRAVYALVFRKGGPKPLTKPADYQPKYGPKAGNELGPITMEAYARILSNATDRPVVDQTGLDGEYMLPILAALSAGNARYAEVHMGLRPASGAPGAPADNSGQLVLDSDISKALIGGLRLEPRKLPMTVLVIDHVDENPTAN